MICRIPDEVKGKRFTMAIGETGKGEIEEIHA